MSARQILSGLVIDGRQQILKATIVNNFK